MTQVNLHPAPRWRDVVLEQIRVVGLAFRREALALAVVAGFGTIVVGMDIIRGTADSWFDSDEWIQIAIVAFFFPFAVWWRDRRFGPAFLWTLPVDRRRLALAKVFAGWVWLTSVLAIFVLWQLALAAWARVENAETVPFVAFSGATGMYLFGSAVVLGLRYPLRWLVGSGALLFLVNVLGEAISRNRLDPDNLPGSARFFRVIENVIAGTYTLSPFPQWALLTFLWVGAGIVALLAALSRHREHRRH